jgi:hypothetical protein
MLFIKRIIRYIKYIRSTAMSKIVIDGIEYVPKSEASTEAQSVNGLAYRIVRTQYAGVFAGYLKSKTDNTVTLLNVRRLWYWSGAASLSQLANEGVKTPDSCKFPAEVSSLELSNWIEILPVTEKAKKSIDSVKIWSI